MTTARPPTLTGALLPLALLALLAAGPALGQATDPEAAEADRPAQEQTGAEPEPEPARPAEDPFDYEASEQISEDLSVSFPVDI